MFTEVAINIGAVQVRIQWCRPKVLLEPHHGVARDSYGEDGPEDRRPPVPRNRDIKWDRDEVDVPRTLAHEWSSHSYSAPD